MGLLKTEFAAKDLAATPLGRVGRPADIASIAVFLASEASGWLTGEILVRDVQSLEACDAPATEISTWSTKALPNF
jgi:NAD(P)-dependent dehydrogenase (short-subunit alcohol dehydrogenase family)